MVKQCRCGREPHTRNDQYGYRIICKCGCASCGCVSEDLATRAWNRQSFGVTPVTNLDQFTRDITSTIQRHRMENDLTYAETIGVLELIKADLIGELKGDNDV